MMSDLIREGFICPECQKDLTCFELLQAHFEIEHANKGKSNDDKTNSLSCNLNLQLFFYQVINYFVGYWVGILISGFQQSKKPCDS